MTPVLTVEGHMAGLAESEATDVAEHGTADLESP
jgi:phosphopantothenate synthetase